MQNHAPSIAPQASVSPGIGRQSVAPGRTGRAPYRGERWHTALNLVLAAVLVLAIGTGIWRATGSPGGSQNNDQSAAFAPGTPEASPAANNGCPGQPTAFSDEELRQKSINDWLPPSYHAGELASPEQAQAMRDIYETYYRCAVLPVIDDDPETVQPEEAESYLSDRYRFTMLDEQDLDATQQADLNDYACFPREASILDHFPLPINQVARGITIPTTYPPSADWESSLADTPVYHLGDGRFGMIYGAISPEALVDPSKATDDDWLVFVAFVEVDGHYYIDEEVPMVPSSNATPTTSGDNTCL